MGRRRLMALLQGSMICASKAKLEAAGLLPSCKKQVRSRLSGWFAIHDSFMESRCGPSVSA